VYSRIKDSNDSYGWVSILLHWMVVCVVMTLWFIGDSAETLGAGDEAIEQIRLHISIAGCTYVVLCLRIGWRLISGHPSLDGQGPVDHWVANTAHYILLGAISAMLLSGPLMVWSGGRDILIFDWFSIPTPMGPNEILHGAMEALHVFSSRVILIVALLHMAGACKHLMFDDDDVFLRMLVPKKK